MSSRITCEVRTTAPVAVVRLAGALHLGTMRSVHRALSDALVDQPEALVVDLADVSVEDRLALSVFAATARRAEEWPAVPVVLCAPSPVAARWLAESTTCRVVPVTADCAEATRMASATLRMRARLEPVAEACRRARELVTDACARWNLPEAAGPAALVLSELVGNVVRHAGTPMQVTVTLRRPYLHLAVVDGSSAQAQPGGTDLHAEGGRGLMLVRELAQRWGSVPAGQGKAVWAMLPAT
ncbi:ATP-binding protein [Micromonospora chokoriensis]|uniref:Histidine kinase-like ATPase domain-containing protein n=1 Tax=Micromonospora chokoriensis TaxID=356851 RepID=A0A1C4YCM9_9ACTN|nr:ATP-binding protein [Micromonospora chokoriensis]SCF18485.1 Histidine kinase-like ATPase domain-containing protein [Micromonospora chokoriensis]